MTKFALVGDVGGTNARLALCDLASGEISRAKTYSGLDYPSLEAVVRVYLEEHQVTVNEGCIAIACPITGDWVAMTNHTWAFSIAEMKRNLGFAHLEIINDFTAVSMAIPMLKAEHLIQFGGSAPVAGKPIAVYGAGTGLGVAHLVHVDKRWVSLPGEGGHVDFAPNSEEEGIILEELRAELGHVSAERVLSGPGLVNLYRAIVKSDGRLPENLQPREVTERALADSCTDCRRALSLFCVIMGRFGGNLALTLGTFGGVYIAGGIVTGAGSLGMVTMGILSAVFPVVVSEAPAGVEWVRIYTGLAGFLKAHGVEWLFALWAAVALAGLWLLAQPPIRRREQTASQFSSWYAAGVAVGLYGVGQTAWYVQLGKLRDLPVLALFLAAAVWCTVRQFWRLGGEPDETRRRQERIIALLYTVAQGVLLLLTAEAGFGLVALVLHIGVYFICAAAITWRRSGRGKH